MGALAAQAEEVLEEMEETSRSPRTIHPVVAAQAAVGSDLALTRECQPILAREETIPPTDWMEAVITFRLRRGLVREATWEEPMRAAVEAEIFN
jgi:hypothetical protein